MANYDSFSDLKGKGLSPRSSDLFTAKAGQVIEKGNVVKRVFFMKVSMKRAVTLLVFVALVLSACSTDQAPVPVEQVGLETQAVAGTRVVSSDGDGWYPVFPALPNGLHYTKVAEGHLSTFVLRSDGRILAKGAEDYCQQQVPPLPSGLRYTDLAVHRKSMLALRSDGQVVGWGAWGDEYKNCKNPDFFPLPKDSRFTAVAAGDTHGMALRSDGTIRAWGSNAYGEIETPPLPAGLHYTVIDAGFSTSFALRSDGQIVAWGRTPDAVPALPAGSAYISLSVGISHALALRNDGQVIGWGSNDQNQLDVPTLPGGLGYTAVAAGMGFSIALRSDNQIVSWGRAQGDGWEYSPNLLLPVGSTYLAVAADTYGASALIADAPQPKNFYAIDFEALTSGSYVSSVALGRGVIRYSRGNLLGKDNTNPIQVFGETPSSTRNQALVLGTMGNKLLTVGSKTPSKTGGTLELSFVPSFNKRGVTVTSLEFAGTTPGSSIKVTTVNGRSATLRIPSSGKPQTIKLDAAQVKSLKVSSPGAFALDDIVFGD